MLKDEEVLTRPREGVEHFMQRNSIEKATLAGEFGEGLCASQCGWSGEQERVYHMTGEQVAERSRSQMT